MADVQPAQPGSGPYTLRITFAYDGPRLEIAGVQRVAMRAPASLEPPEQENRSGHWLEVRDANGALIYHRPIHDPRGDHVESYGSAPGHPMRRHEGTAARGEFEVLVPDLPNAASFRLHGPSAASAAGHQARLTARSAPLHERSFEDLRRMAGQGSRR